MNAKIMATDLSAKGFENGLRLLAPALLLVVLFLLSVTALPVPRFGPVKPALLLMAIYYWSIYRPTITPPWLCFSIGLLLDFVSGLPLGVNAIVLTLVQMIVRDQRRFLMGQPYITIWAVFSLVVALAAALQWALYGLVNFHWAPPMPIMMNLIASVFLFPAVTLLLILVHRVLPTVQKNYP